MVRTSGVDDAFSGIPETLLYDGGTSMSSTTFQINIEICGLENTKKKGKHKLVVVIVLEWQTFLLMHWIPSKRENARRVAFSGNGTLIEFNRSHPITLKKVIVLWNTSQSWTLFNLKIFDLLAWHNLLSFSSSYSSKYWKTQHNSYSQEFWRRS